MWYINSHPLTCAPIPLLLMLRIASLSNKPFQLNPLYTASNVMDQLGLLVWYALMDVFLDRMFLVVNSVSEIKQKMRQHVVSIVYRWFLNVYSKLVMNSWTHVLQPVLVDENEWMEFLWQAWLPTWSILFQLFGALQLSFFTWHMCQSNTYISPAMKEASNK